MTDYGVLMSSGQNVVLPDQQPRLHAVAAWTDPEGACEVELSALLLAESGRVRSDADMIFYNQPVSEDGSVRHLGNTASESGAEARVAVDLEAVHADVASIVLVASIEGGTFGTLEHLVLTTLDVAGAPLVRFDITTASTETAFVLGEIYRRGEKWRLRAVGQGWDSGLAGLATDFGIAISDEDSAGGPPEPADVVPVEAAPVEKSAEPPRAAVRPGLRTRRSKPIRVAPPTMADDDSWQPARLFSVSGVGAAEEQEKRATSALLSSMVAVRGFGRGIAAHLGAPAGPMETFLEVQLTLGERTVIPDGIIRVTRGGRTWTALVETKTGGNALRTDQVERYLDVARERGWDAVVTISNEIAPAAGVHPLEVDRRKLKKVVLHHLSWSEVLHEARMLLTHRGAADPLQAWVLHELIRYLSHPKSGAVPFADMGAGWVAVRESVAAGTLRASDRKVPAVAESWARLVRHLILHLTADLGVQVRQVLPRNLASDPRARAQHDAAQLAAVGTFDATLKVPDAAGPLSVVADLRTTQVRVGVEVAAPSEGGTKRRIGWLIRQLKDAPDALLVEVRYSGSTESACEQLKDVRSDPTALIGARTTDVRGFTLTLVTPMGTKRSGVKGAFVPSVTAAVEALYRTVVQQVRPWTPPAPALPESDAVDPPST